MTVKTVFYTCSFVPPELITACGCIPQRLVPALGNGSSLTEGMCAFTESWLETLVNQPPCGQDFAAIFSTSCDQMRRAYDLYCQHSKHNAFLLNVPSTNTEHALHYYMKELKRLQLFLSDFCDKEPEAIQFDQDHLLDRRHLQTKKTPQIKIAITGGPIPIPVRKEIDVLLEMSDAAIALDVAEDTQRPVFSPLLSKQDLRDDLMKLAEVYFHQPAIWKRPNYTFYQHLLEDVSKYEIDGIILFRYVFCDLWHSTAYELRKRLTLPVLEIDLDGKPDISASAVSRIQAFLETLAL